MNEKVFHDLAVAYAQAKLLQFQQKHPEESCSDTELRSFLKAYNYALYQLPIEDNDLDEHF